MMIRSEHSTYSGLPYSPSQIPRKICTLKRKRNKLSHKFNATNKNCLIRRITALALCSFNYSI